MLNEDALKEFIFDCQLRKLSKRTVSSYKNANLRMMKFIKEEYGIDELEDTHHQAIKGYIQYLINQGLSEVYINRNIVCYKCYFRYCMEEGYINRNPMDKIKKQKEAVRLIETFTNDEVARLLKVFRGANFLDIRNHFILVLLFDTGIRNSELCDLKVSDVRETYIRIIGKGNKERHVPITPSINKDLVRYMRVRNEYIKDKVRYQTEYLLLSQKGRRLTPEALEYIMKKAGEAAKIKSGVRVSPHTCRHFYAQSQLKNGCDLYTVSKLLGHSKVETTKRYLQSMHDSDLMDIAVKTSPLSKL
jgi:integrase/recombinase XerD